MKNLFKTLPFILILLFLSCKKQVENIPNNTTSLIEKNEIVISNNQYKSVGDLHNEYLEDFLQRNLSDDSLMYLNSDELNFQQKIDIFNEMPINNVLELSTTQIEYINMVKNVLEQYDNYDDIKSGIENIESIANNNLTGIELQKILMAMSVAKSSSYFWLDAENGGSGLGSLYLDNLDFYIVGKKATKNDYIIAADCKGALEAAGTWAAITLLFGGPATLTAYLATVAAGAASASYKKSQEFS